MLLLNHLKSCQSFKQTYNFFYIKNSKSGKNKKSCRNEPTGVGHVQTFTINEAATDPRHRIEKQLPLSRQCSLQ